jgi:hypothetical protein
MNLIKHLLIVMVLDAGAVLAFGGDEQPQPASPALCALPANAAPYPALETTSTSLRTTTEHVHENQ